jgi:tetratricopeptide (TPR) repeat protein
MVMNITIVWIVLGFAALLLALYLFSFAYWDNDTQHYKRSQRVPWFTMTLFIVSLVAIFFGGFFNSLASKHQNISWNDTRPSFEMTLRAAKKSIVHNVATGYGPNSFEGTWSLIKPVALSGGDSSRTGFSQGVGFIPTQMATNGILGIIAWVLFFVTLAGVFVRKIRAGFTHSLDRYFAIGMGISILYLSILAWVYIPGHYFLVLLAILVGAFIAIFDIHPHKPDRMISFIKDPRASFFGILGITMIIVLALFLGYIGIRKTASLIHYSKGIIALNQGKFSDANTQISFAAVYANHDIYRHQLAVFALNDVAQLVSKATATTKDASSQQIEKSLGIALAHAQVATQINSMDYTNWVLLGDVYRSMVSLGVSDAYDRAYQAYEEAQKRNPNDSTMILHFAQLALAQKDRDGALELIKQSINKYPTADAYIARAQIQLGQQKNDSAEESLKAALALDPYNVDLAYQYGLLLLSQRRYTDAIPVLQRVVVMNRKYASAYVYLGYALERSGDTVTADRVYEYIKKEFPGGAEAITAVKNGQIDQSAPTVPSADLGTKDTSKLLPQKEVAPASKK